MSKHTASAAGEAMPIPLPPDLTRLRDRIETAVSRLIAALDAIDAPDEDLEEGHDREQDPAESGIGDADGLAEQLNGEPDLGATEHIDQRQAWRASSGWGVLDGEATGTIDDCDPYRPDETPAQWLARLEAREQARKQALADLRAIVSRKNRELAR